MDPLSHGDHSNWLEEIAKKIPAFRGYTEREHRRESDKLARTHLADQLRGARSAIDRVLRRLADDGHLDSLAEIERLRVSLDALELRVWTAPRGYSGFFDYVQVDRERLDEVLLLDLELGRQADGILENAETLAENTFEPNLIMELANKTDRLSIEFDKRRRILAGLAD